MTGTIDDYLLGLAEGVEKAQRQLSQVSLELNAGDAPIMYQIPRVDFELKLSLEMVTADDGMSAKLQFRPASGGGGSRQTTTEASSTLRGSLVAVPRLGGKPRPVLRTTLRRIDPKTWRWQIRVEAATAAGEALAGVNIQFNVDREKSRELTEKLASLPEETSLALSSNTRFSAGVATTDSRGVASVTLEADMGEPKGSYIAAVIDALGETETVIFRLD
ncbi:MAG: hypothetical protein KC431_06195 [Myxococcales bacterium]|nr:hypothetical protein [Myxococcales bacterium]